MCFFGTFLLRQASMGDVMGPICMYVCMYVHATKLKESMMSKPLRLFSSLSCPCQCHGPPHLATICTYMPPAHGPWTIACPSRPQPSCSHTLPNPQAHKRHTRYYCMRTIIRAISPAPRTCSPDTSWSPSEQHKHMFAPTLCKPTSRSRYR